MANRKRTELEYNKMSRLINEQRSYIDTHNYEGYINPCGVRRADRAYLARLVAAQLSGKPIWTKTKPGVTGIPR